AALATAAAASRTAPMTPAAARPRRSALIARPRCRNAEFADSDLAFELSESGDEGPGDSGADAAEPRCPVAHREGGVPAGAELAGLDPGEHVHEARFEALEDARQDVGAE